MHQVLRDSSFLVRTDDALARSGQETYIIFKNCIFDFLILIRSRSPATSRPAIKVLPSGKMARKSICRLLRSLFKRQTAVAKNQLGPRQILVFQLNLPNALFSNSLLNSSKLFAQHCGTLIFCRIPLIRRMLPSVLAIKFLNA